MEGMWGGEGVEWEVIKYIGKAGTERREWWEEVNEEIARGSGEWRGGGCR